MKHRHWSSCLWGSGLAALLSSSGIGCLITAFDFPTVQANAVFLWCIAAALCFSLFYRFRLQLIPAAILVLLGGYLWIQGSLERSAEALLYQITAYYDSAYACGVLMWGDSVPKTGDTTLALCAIGVLIVFGICDTVCTVQPAWSATGIALLPLGACMVVANTVPDPVYLYLLLVGIALLIIPNMRRRTDPKQGSILTAILVIPVLLAAALLFQAVPEKEYSRQQQAATLYDAVLGWLPGFTQSESGSSAKPPFSGSSEAETVDLTNVGRQDRSQRVVMELSGTATGTLYLRGQALDTYTGKTWTSSQRNDPLSWPSQSLLKPAGTLTVTTRNVLPIQYVPYYSKGITPDAYGYRIENKDKETVFPYEVMSLPGDLASLAVSTPDIPPAETISLESNRLNYVTYIYMPSRNLPESTRIWAEALLETVLQPEDRENPVHTAAAIAAWVSSSAQYDLRVNTMPREQEDFVRWFLEEQDEGYCVHFASAATVLLRAAGIPARYVTGYLAVKNADSVTVRQADAHAWAEYWVNGIGWMVLEATPGDSQSPVPTQTAASTTQTTEPTATATGTEPSASLPTQPASATAPSEAPKEPSAPSRHVGRNLLKSIGWIILTACILVLQWKLRFAFRQQRLRRGNTNARAVALWREAAYLAKLLGEQPQSSLFAIAQKAKFSQYTLLLKELEPLEKYVRQSQDRLRKSPGYLRLLYQFLLAVC